MDDLYALPTSLETNNVYPEFEAEWERHLETAAKTEKVQKGPRQGCPSYCCTVTFFEHNLSREAEQLPCLFADGPGCSEHVPAHRVPSL
jgi:hypothetical protein